jgi:hypothetical protein
MEWIATAKEATENRISEIETRALSFERAYREIIARWSQC